MKFLIGLLFVVIGIVLVVYLPLVYLLYGGIMQAVSNWGLDNSLVVWGILRVVFFEFGVVPGFILIAVGMSLLSD